jgi:hypothetical protein
MNAARAPSPALRLIADSCPSGSAAPRPESARRVRLLLAAKWEAAQHAGLLFGTTAGLAPDELTSSLSWQPDFLLVPEPALAEVIETLDRLLQAIQPRSLRWTRDDLSDAADRAATALTLWQAYLKGRQELAEHCFRLAGSAGPQARIPGAQRETFFLEESAPTG